MSHIVQIQTQVRDPVAVRDACRRLNLAAPVQGTFDVFGTEATGLGVRLPDWDFPIVCDTTTGKVQYDNYNGAWGDPKELDRFMQAYAVEKAKIEARKKGHIVTEQPLADGSIKLTVNLGGAA
jgi:hypothetical protein